MTEISGHGEGHVSLRRVIVVIAGMSLGFLCVWLSTRGVEWRAMIDVLGQADFARMAIGTVCFLGTYSLHSLRWNVLLGGPMRVSQSDTLSATLIGYMMNTILPLRLGEIARTVIVKRKLSAPFFRVFGSTTTDRLFDLLTLTVLAPIAIAFADLPLAAENKNKVIVAGVFVLAVLSLFVPAARSRKFRRAMVAAAGWLPGRWPRRLRRFFLNFTRGLASLTGFADLLRVVALSFASWGVLILGVSQWLQAFPLTVPLWQTALALVVVINLGMAVPSTPASIGVFHQVVIWTLGLWLVEKNAAFAFAVSMHGVTTVMIGLLGSACLLREHTSLWKLYRSVANR